MGRESFQNSSNHQDTFHDVMCHHCMQDILTTPNHGKDTNTQLDEGHQREVVQLVPHHEGALSKLHGQYRQEGERRIENRDESHTLLREPPSG